MTGETTTCLRAGERAGASHRLRLGVEVLHDVDVRERVDLRRDRVADSVPGLELGTRAVELGEVDLRAADERSLRGDVRERRSRGVHELGPRRLGGRGRLRIGVHDEHAVDRRTACEHLRDGGEVGFVVFREMQRQLEVRADRARRVAARGERLAPLRPVEA